MSEQDEVGSLDQLLSGEKAEPVTDQLESEAKDDDAKEDENPENEDLPTGEKKDDSTPESDDDLTPREKGYYATTKTERQKRQAIERELEELRAEIKSKSAAEPENRIDPVDDPDGFNDALDRKIAEVELKTKISSSQMWMRNQYKDYDEKEEAFLELAKENPFMFEQMKAHDIPAKFVYDSVVNHERMANFGSFDEALEKAVSEKVSVMEQTIREKIEKEYKAKFDRADSLPPSGAGGSKGSDSTYVKSSTLSDILGEKT